MKVRVKTRTRVRSHIIRGEAVEHRVSLRAVDGEKKIEGEKKRDGGERMIIDLSGREEIVAIDL